MKVCLYRIKILTYHAHRRQNILVSPQDRLACPIQHLLRCSKAAPGQGEMQTSPRCNSSTHQLECLTALVLREVGVTSFHIEFELYSPDDKHARVAQLALPSLQTFFTRDTVSVFFEMSGWLAMTKFPLKAFLETYFPTVAICVPNFFSDSHYSRLDRQDLNYLCTDTLQSTLEEILRTYSRAPALADALRSIVFFFRIRNSEAALSETKVHKINIMNYYLLLHTKMQPCMSEFRFGTFSRAKSIA